MKKWILVLALLSACEKEAPAPLIRPVRAQTVASPEEARRRTFSGTAKASEEARLSFKVSGTVTGILVNVGDPIVKDQLLAQLDPFDYQIEVERTRAELEKAEARARNAAAQYERVRNLYETRTASRTDLDNARANSEASRAAVASAQKALALANRQLTYTALLAPTHGYIAEKIAEVNENVRPNQPVLAMVSGTEPEVEIQMPETMIGHIEQGQLIDAKFPAIGERLEGEVIYIGVATTGSSTTFPVTIRIDDPQHDVRSGMTAEVSFTLPYKPGEDIVTIPAVAVGEDLEGPYVYLVTDYDGRTGIIARQPVHVGEFLGDKIEITEGLHGGERVVTAGLEFLSPGTRVSLYKGKPYDKMGN